MSELSKSELKVILASITFLPENPSASVQEIISNADISRRTFYKYFSSKDEVFEKISLHIIESYSQMLKSISDKSLDDYVSSYIDSFSTLSDQLMFMYHFPYLYYKNEINKKYQEYRSLSKENVSKRLPKDSLLDAQWFADHLELLSFGVLSSVLHGGMNLEKSKKQALLVIDSVIKNKYE